MNLYDVSMTIRVDGVRVIADDQDAAGEKAACMVANDLNREHEVIDLAVVDVEGGEL
jgi:hypothetical protein